MNRFSLVALALSAAPALARGESPAVPPVVSTPTAVVTMPAAPVSCTPPLMQPLPVTPTVPPPVGTCVTYTDKRPGLFQSLLGCFRPAASCEAGCPAPKPIKISPAKGCSADGGATAAGHAQAHVLARPAATGSCWEKFKTWLCWKPCNEQLLHLTPDPYRAPLLAYFPYCEPPSPALPCGTCGHAKHVHKGDAACATGGCPTGGCPTAYGPVVSPWVYAGTAAPPAVTVPTPVTAPMPPAAPPQPPANPLARPFTTP